MSDDISIPQPTRSFTPSPDGTSYTHTYRSRRTGMDSSTRRLVFAAAGLGLVLLGGMGVWTFTGHRSAAVPVIEADQRPLRVKPEDPGGMTVVGANDQVMGGRGDGAGSAGDLAPEAERPDPQALRAQRQAAAAPSAQPAAPVLAPAAPTTTAAAPPSPSPAAIAKAEPAAKPAAGAMLVQIAAVDSEGVALSEWQRLAHKAPELLGDRKPVVSRAERDGKVFWRVRTGGFADTAAAAEFCRKVRAKGLGCTIAG